MTATRMRTVGRLATLAAFAVAWLGAAILLWRTQVPSGLDTGGLDVHRYFTPLELGKARSYAGFARIDWLLSVAATIVALAVLSRRAPRIARGIGLGRVGTAIVVGMVILVTLWFVSLPFGIAQQWWDHRHGLAPGNYLAWLLAPWAQLSSEAGFAMATIVIVVGLASKLGRRWWIVGAPVFVALAALFAFTSGWILGAGTHGLSPGLRQRVTMLERREHVLGTPVSVETVSDFTHEANAYSVGTGPSRHVVIWDTLLDGRFSDGEVNVVVAHELGHVARRHILKGVAWFALLAFPGAFLVAEITRRRSADGLADPGNLPFALLVLTVLNLVAAPVQNAISRRYEAEADWIALRSTRDPASARALFESFQRTSLEEPSPPLWDYLLLESHPTLIQRIAMAERWRATTRRRGGAAPRAGS